MESHFRLGMVAQTYNPSLSTWVGCLSVCLSVASASQVETVGTVTPPQPSTDEILPLRPQFSTFT